MTDWNIATGKEQPINRTGFDNVQESGSEVQGMLVGIDNSGTDPMLVQADAGASANSAGNGPVTAVGALFPREIIPEDVANYVNQHPWDDVEEQIYREERTLTGDRATAVQYGIELVNDAEDTSFTPGEPVYLDVGGGFTQTKPSTSGEAVQVVGMALTPEDEGNGNSGRPRMLLDVDIAYDMVA
jgi:hypothetical protein